MSYPVCFVHKYRGIKSGKFSFDEISYSNFKNLNHNEFVADLDNAPWSLLDMFDDVNEKLDTWEWIFNDVMNRHAPIVKKRVKHKPLLPWMNNDILQLMYHRDQFKARAKSNILAGIMYKRLRNQVVKTIAKAKTDYVRNGISKNMNNPRKLWKTLKRIAPTKSAPSNLSFIETEDKSVCDPTEMANTFNKHFTNIQQNADTVIPVVDTNKQNQRLTDFVESRINNSTVFHIPQISLKQVVEDLKNIPDNKVTGLDGIGIKPLKVALNAVAPSLTHIYNAGIASSSFPDNFKRAKPTTVPKNNSIHDRNNYHPISILPVISKPLERHVA